MGRSVFEYHEQQMRDNPEYKAAYDALEQEFAIANALIQARSEAGMTQKDVAEKLGVSQPAVARMESGKPAMPRPWAAPSICPSCPSEVGNPYARPHTSGGNPAERILEAHVHHAPCACHRSRRACNQHS